MLNRLRFTIPIVVVIGKFLFIGIVLIADNRLSVDLQIVEPEYDV